MNVIAQELKRLEMRPHQTRSGSIQDGEAKEKVLYLLSQFKAHGQKHVDIIDLKDKLHLPVEQIENIMEQLEKEGRVKADE